MLDSELLEKVKSKGYWKIEIIPSNYKNRFSLADCKRILKESEVRIRGWYYPYVSNISEEFYVGNNYAQSFCDWQEHIEICRFYQSGQFVHYLGIWEDYLSEYRGLFENKSPKVEEFPPETIIEVINLLYTISEIFQFIFNLFSNKIYDEKISLIITIYKTKGRRLQILDTFRRLHSNYICHFEPIEIKKTLEKDDLENHKELSLKMTLEIIEKFNWHAEHIENVLRKDQENFFARKF